MAVLLSLVAAAVFGAADFAGGFATRRMPVLLVTVVSNGIGAIMGVALVVLLGGDWSRGAIGWGAAAGIFGLVGLLLLYLGLSVGPNRLVSPLSAVLAAVLPVMVGLVDGDRPDRLAVIGLALVGPAIWLVAGGEFSVPTAAPSLAPPAASRAESAGEAAAASDPGSYNPMLLAVGAGIGFGLFFTCLAQTPDGAGATPILVARIVSTSMLVAAVGLRRPVRPAGSSFAPAMVAGGLDMGANGLFLWSTRLGDLAVVGALVNLFPVTTIVLAALILGERLTRSQSVGLVLAIAAAALLG